MGTREYCNKCGCFFIIGQEEEICPHNQIDEHNAETWTELKIKEALGKAFKGHEAREFWLPVKKL